MTSTWTKTVPPKLGTKLLLRTVGGVPVIGFWVGELGQYFTGWCLMPTD